MTTRSTRARATRLTDDRGFVAGGEVLMLGVLTMIVGTLLIIELWAVLDARIAVDDAAREATRAYVEAESHDQAVAQARAAAAEVLGDRGRVGTVEPAVDALPWSRCVRVEVTIRAEVPRFAIPVIGGLGHHVVIGRHSELVDPHRSSLDLPGVGDCGT